MDVNKHSCQNKKKEKSANSHNLIRINCYAEGPITQEKTSLAWIDFSFYSADTIHEAVTYAKEREKVL